jgi:hypothetical protein
LSSQLLYGNSDEIPLIPPDRILGKYVSSGLGMDGRFKDNSEVRRDVTGYVNEDGSYDFERGDTRTEVMTPADLVKTRNLWQAKQRAENMGSDYKTSTSNEQFDNLAGEYYGQQGLKLAGMKAPVGEQMDGRNLANSLDVRPAVQAQSIAGKDRLIVDNTGITGNDIYTRFKPADFRYVDEKGSVIIGDYQRANDDGLLRMNLAKASGLNEQDRRQLQRDMVDIAQSTGLTDIDDIFLQAVNNQGINLSNSKGNSEIRSNKQIRAGKGLASGDKMGEYHSRMDNMPPDQIIYGIGKDSIQPTDIKVVDTAEFRKQAAQDLLDGKMMDLYTQGRGGSIETNIDAPGRSLLDADQMAQISEPYALDKPIQKIARPKRASEMTAQERYEARQIKLQQRFGGPRVDPNY